MPRIDLPSDPASPSVGLRALDGWLAGCDETFADRVRLAAGEALGNAVEHGPGEPIAFEWTPTARGGRLRIRDGGRLPAGSIHAATLPAHDATRGRGLYILDALTDRVTVEADGTLRLEFDG